VKLLNKPSKNCDFFNEVRERLDDVKQKIKKSVGQQDKVLAEPSI